MMKRFRSIVGHTDEAFGFKVLAGLPRSSAWRRDATV